MTYAYSAGLQAAVYQRLASDAEVSGLVGAAIYDAPLTPSAGTVASDYITIGEEVVRASDTKTSRGAVHDFRITAHSGRDGFDAVKRLAAGICAALLDAPLVLDAGRLVALRFLQAKADRGPSPEKRRVSMRFRAVVDQDI